MSNCVHSIDFPEGHHWNAVSSLVKLEGTCLVKKTQGVSLRERILHAHFTISPEPVLVQLLEVWEAWLQIAFSHERSPTVVLRTSISWSQPPIPLDKEQFI